MLSRPVKVLSPSSIHFLDFSSIYCVQLGSVVINSITFSHFFPRLSAMSTLRFISMLLNSPWALAWYLPKFRKIHRISRTSFNEWVEKLIFHFWWSFILITYTYVIVWWRLWNFIGRYTQCQFTINDVNSQLVPFLIFLQILTSLGFLASKYLIVTVS